jgi:hypothetical protein
MLLKEICPSIPWYIGDADAAPRKTSSKSITARKYPYMWTGKKQSFSDNNNTFDRLDCYCYCLQLVKHLNFLQEHVTQNIILQTLINTKFISVKLQCLGP